ncbi:MAG: cation diffusion facilitator family transporter [Candidatus Wildermuthbacteria bacterium]|nr:cation diffusion facilitator family transporter [Candidatus Wildermuthbacteria bacterium]
MEFQKVRKVLIITLLLNWLVAIAKILIGFATGAISILADGFHSLFDGASNIIGLIAVKLSAKPIDSGHPYGHRKFETVATLGIVFLILFAGYEFLKNSIQRFFHPVTPEITGLSFLVMAGALLADAFTFFYENHQGKKLKSAILIADSLHTKTHLLITPAVIVGIAAVKIGLPIFDPIIAIIITFMLAKLAWEIVEHATLVLCDRALVEEGRIRKIAQTINGIDSSHQIRTRGDEYHVFLDMHISLNPELSLREAHSVSHELKEKIMREITQIKDVVIHIEPSDKA